MAIDYADCSTIIEEGIATEDPSSGDYDSTGISQTLGNATSDPVGHGYFLVRWEDFLGIKVNEVKNEVTFTYDGTCTTRAEFLITYSWLAGTGWFLESHSERAEIECARAQAFADASFKNSLFPVLLCPHPLFVTSGYVRTVYDDVQTVAGHDGTIDGAVLNTYAEYVGAGVFCPPLHYETELSQT